MSINIYTNITFLCLKGFTLPLSVTEGLENKKSFEYLSKYFTHMCLKPIVEKITIY